MDLDKLLCSADEYLDKVSANIHLIDVNNMSIDKRIFPPELMKKATGGKIHPNVYDKMVCSEVDFDVSFGKEDVISVFSEWKTQKEIGNSLSGFSGALEDDKGQLFKRIREWTEKTFLAFQKKGWEIDSELMQKLRSIKTNINTNTISQYLRKLALKAKELLMKILGIFEKLITRLSQNRGLVRVGKGIKTGFNKALGILLAFIQGIYEWKTQGAPKLSTFLEFVLALFLLILGLYAAAAAAIIGAIILITEITLVLLDKKSITENIADYITDLSEKGYQKANQLYNQLESRIIYLY